MCHSKMADGTRQNRSLANGVFSVYITYLSVVIISLFNIFILYLDFKLLNGCVCPTGSYGRVGI